MNSITTVLVEQGRATALTLDTQGRVGAIGRGDDLWSAVRATGDAGGDVIVADDRDLPAAVAIGVIDILSRQSAERTLGLAGCDVIEALSINDGLEPAERAGRIVDAAPRVILLAGGTDGGDVQHLGEFAEVIVRARDILEGQSRPVPVIVYAGNPEARHLVRGILGEGTFRETDNIRPACERESLASAAILLGFVAAGAAAPESPDSVPPRAWTAGAARSAAVHELARLLECDTLLLHEGPHGAAAISSLGEHWNGVLATRGDFGEAVALHRKRARELSGVPLLRGAADAFVDYVPGRDLLDVNPPTRIIGSGAAFAALPPAEAAERLIDVVRPRGTVTLSRVTDLDLALLGLATLGGHPVHVDAHGRILRDLGLVVSVDGPACDILVMLPEGDHLVPAGEIRRFPIEEPCSVDLEPSSGGDIGLGSRRPVSRDVPAMEAGLIVDARGTPVPPERRVRILDRA